MSEIALNQAPAHLRQGSNIGQAFTRREGVLKVTGGDGITVGPILLGAAATVHIMTPSATVRRILNMTALAVANAGAVR